MPLDDAVEADGGHAAQKQTAEKALLGAAAGARSGPIPGLEISRGRPVTNGNFGRLLLPEPLTYFKMAPHVRLLQSMLIGGK